MYYKKEYTTELMYMKNTFKKEKKEKEDSTVSIFVLLKQYEDIFILFQGIYTYMYKLI